MQLSMFFGLFGGLGLFIFGMKQMSEGLQKTAGKKLRHILARLTTKPIIGVLVGAGVTSVIQSSSATTVMVVGFVNAGLMTLAQSIGVIMGANVGTTITAQLVAFKLSHYALHAVAIGAGFYLFSKKGKTRQIGQIILGFGILFLGLNIMKETMEPLADSALFVDIMGSFGKSPILGLILGTAMTIVLQSSSASIGILMSLLSVGVINYWVAVPILLGDNIGTTITAILSSVGANRTAKRAAAAHFIFNLMGSAIVVVLFYIIPDFANVVHDFIVKISTSLGELPSQERLLANTHTFFNITNTLVWLPFVGLMERMVIKILPGDDSSITRGVSFIDERMLETPSVAIAQIQNEIVRMHEIARNMVKEGTDAFLTGDLQMAQEVIGKEDIVNDIEEELLTFLTRMPRGSLSEMDRKMLDIYYTITDAIESIADDANDLAELTFYKAENNVRFSQDAAKTLHEIFSLICDLLDKSITLVKIEDLRLVPELLEAEKQMDDLQLKSRDEHMERFRRGTCDPNAGIIYLEALDDMEHISDQFADIAHSIKEKYKN